MQVSDPSSAMIVELAIVEPWLALTNVGDIGPPIYVGFTAFLGEIDLEAKPFPKQKQIHANITTGKHLHT